MNYRKCDEEDELEVLYSTIRNCYIFKWVSALPQNKQKLFNKWNPLTSLKVS